MTPRIKPVSAKKSAILSALDVGTSKVVCLIARLDPMDQSDTLRGRTHRMRVLGIGHQRSRGLKGGVVVDLEEAEQAIRLAVDAAERMAGVHVESTIVNITGGRLASRHFSGSVALNRRTVSDAEVHRVMDAAIAQSMAQGRTVLHSLPVGYALDESTHIRDPRGMIGETLNVDMHVTTCDTLAQRNLMLGIERGHLNVETLVATPYASGLSTLVDDEAEMGVACIDLGGGTTSVGIFNRNRLVHCDAVAVGGNHITMDLARGLSMRLDDAERLKTLTSSCIETAQDDRDLIAIRQVGEDSRDYPNQIPRSQVTRIVKPRVEEILELVRDRLQRAGFALNSGQRIVLTGGGAQLAGLAELSRKVLTKHVRIGRPVGIQGLPEAAKSPAFATAVGLIVYPQVAALEHFEPTRGGFLATGTDGYFSRVGRWLRESF
jgi:cell division protein FtsA